MRTYKQVDNKDSIQLVLFQYKLNNKIKDDCNFHECVNANELDMNKTLRI